MASQTQTSTYALPSSAMKNQRRHSHSLGEPHNYDAPSQRPSYPHSHSHSNAYHGPEASKHASHSQHQAFDHYPHSRSTAAMNANASEAVMFPNGVALNTTSDASLKGRTPGESDWGRPFHTVPLDGADASFDGSRKLSMVSQSPSLAAEILTAVMLPLPFLLASLLSVAAPSPPQHRTAVELVEEIASEALPISPKTSNMIQACLLTSGILISLGLSRRLYRSKSSAVTSPTSSFLEGVSLDFALLRNLLHRMLTVGLPFLATVELGGGRTGIILLSFVASGLMIPEMRIAQGVGSWRHILSKYKWTFVVLFICLIFDLNNLQNGEEAANVFRGYVALTKCALFLQIPLPSTASTLPSSPTASKGVLSQSRSDSIASSSSTVANAFDNSDTNPGRFSPLITSIQDADLTLTAGCILCLFTTFLAGTLSLPLSPDYRSLIIASAVITSATTLYLRAEPQCLQSTHRAGLIVGMLMCVSFASYLENLSTTRLVPLLVMCVVFYITTRIGSPMQRTHKKSEFPGNQHEHSHSGHHHHHHHHHHGTKTSSFTKLLLSYTEGWPTLHGILREKESRRLVYFMSINLGFMFVQTFYAFLSGSLGLLSDSIHMFFDCMGLLAGLIAAVMSKWPPSPRFPYGYGKVETLSGLGNGIFLMIISVEIIWESFERFVEGAPLQHLAELLLVSIAGLAVNVLGLLFIPHAHHHGHDHGDAHHHDHSNENMHGIWLHVLADTMGSVAVIASTILTWYTGWSGWDPLASFVIAVLIIAASWPLVAGSAQRLLLTIPSEIEYGLRNTLQELSDLRGVAGYAVPRFWLDDGHANGHDHGQDHGHSHDSPQRHHGGDGHDHSYSHHRSHSNPHSHSHNHHHHHHHHHHHDHDEHHHNHDKVGPKILGVIHVIASRASDLEDLRGRIDRFFKEKNMDILIHIEREGQGECWCGKHGVGGANPGFVSM